MEALTYSLLNDNDKIFVPFIGVYSTREHPFALVFKFMDRQNLREYLGDNQDIERLGLVCFHHQIRCFLSSHHIGVSYWK